MFQHDTAHTGTTNSSAQITKPIIDWSFQSDGSDPIIAGGILYFSSSRSLCALNASTGETIWSTPNTSGNNLVIADGVLYSNRYNALNASTGVQLWNTTYYRPGALAVINGYWYGNDQDAFLICRNASTGTEIWKSQTYSLSQCPAVVNDTIYFGGNGLEALDAYTGSRIWQIKIWGINTGSPTVSLGCVYIGTSEGIFYCVNAFTGEHVWNFTSNGKIFSSPAVLGNYIYFGSMDGNLYALNASSGQKIWNYTCRSDYEDWGSGIRSAPSVADGVVYALSNDGNLYAFDAYTGSKLWNYTLYLKLDRTINPQYIYGSPVISNGKIYIEPMFELIALKNDVSTITSTKATPDVTLYVEGLLILGLITITIILFYRKQRKATKH